MVGELVVYEKWDVANQNTHPSRGRNINVIVSNPILDDHFQFLCLTQHLLVDRSVVAKDCIGVLDEFDDFIFFSGLVEIDPCTNLLENVLFDFAFLEITVRDNNLESLTHVRGGGEDQSQ